MKLKPLFVVGKSNEKEWSGVYGYRPDDSMDSSELYAIIRVASLSSSMPLEQVAKMLLDELQHAFYDQTDLKDDYIIRLENAAWKMKSQMDVIISREEEISRIGLDIEMAIALVENNFLYAAVIGESKILIKRDGNLIDISEALIDANLMGFLRTGSLEITEQDKILLQTSKVDDADVVQELINEFSIKQAFFDNNIGASALMIADERLFPYDTQVSDEPIPVADFKTEESSSEEIPINSDEVKEFITEEDFFQNELNEQSSSEEKIPETQELVQDEDSVFSAESTQEIEQPTEFQDPANLSRFDQFKNKLSPLKTGLLNKASNLRSRINKPENSTFDDSEEVSDLESELNTDESENDVLSSPLKLNTLLQTEEELTGNRVVIILKRILRGAKNFVTTIISAVRNHFKNNNKTYAKYINDLTSKIGQLVNYLVTTFKREFLGTGDRKDMYTKAKRRKRNRIILVIAVIILGIILVNSINASNAARADQERVDAARATTDDLRATLTQLESGVNGAKAGDDAKKNDFISRVESLVTSTKNQKTRNLFVSELDTILTSAEKIKDNVLSVTPFTQPQIITDFGKLYPESTLEDIVYSNGNLYVSDSVRNVIYQIGTVINSQPAQYVTGLVQPSVLVKNVGNDIIFYDNDATSGMGKISLQENGRITRYPGLAPSVIGTIAKAAIYDGNDSLYEIHQNHQQIFKRSLVGADYEGGGSVYVTTNPPNWKTDPELNSAIDIEAPYEIYALVANSGLRRYLGGGDNSITEETFKNTLASDIESIKKATAIDIDGNTLAVADPLNQRVILFTIEDNDAKNLIFQRQFVYRGAENVFKNIKEIVINQAAKGLFVLDGTKVIRLDI